MQCPYPQEQDKYTEPCESIGAATANEGDGPSPDGVGRRLPPVGPPAKVSVQVCEQCEEDKFSGNSSTGCQLCDRGSVPNDANDGCVACEAGRSTSSDGTACAPVRSF